MKMPYLRFVESVWMFVAELSAERTAPRFRIDLHETDGADVRPRRRFELVVLREHDAEHESGRNLARVRLTHGHVGERTRARPVHLARAQQVHGKQLAIEQKLRRLQRDLGRGVQPRRAKLHRVHVPMLDDRRSDWLPAHIEGTA